MDPELAIIIPAYKPDFLDAALASIAAQTDKRFVVYIGDDASPHALYSIVQQYEEKINLVYKRFRENIGGHDLVGQWHRCIEMAGNEAWIWLFSDDDTMEANCIASFYAALDQHRSADLFHFNIRVIDDKGDIIARPAAFPPRLGIVDFNLAKWQSKILSYVVEYIFRKESFVKNGGVEHFDHAWHADEATWTKIGWEHGIITIPGSYVNWRRSSVNITSDVRSDILVKGKLNASINFAKWVTSFYKTHNTQLSYIQRFHLAKRFVAYLSKCSIGADKKICKEYMHRQLQTLGLSYLYFLFLGYFLYKSK